MSKETNIWLIRILPGIVVTGIVIIARLTGTLQFFEWKLLDFFLRLRPPEPTDERIVIIGINQDDIERIGTYPIPDREIAKLIKQLKQYQPAVIGLDLRRELPVEPGYSELLATFQQSNNLIAVERLLPPKEGSPTGLPAEQIGFADFFFDADFHVRRTFLGSPDPFEPLEPAKYKFSLSLQLAKAYLSATQGINLDNGIRDPDTMRFGSTELPRFFSNSGGYVNTDAGGLQTLLNFRNRPHPFRILSLQDIKTGNVEADLLRDRIVIIGITDPRFTVKLKTAAIAGLNSREIDGVEFQAHAVSQIISAVLDRRSLLRSWSDGWEYLWIVIWGFLGVSFEWYATSRLRKFLGVSFASIGLVGAGYLLLYWGWWISMIPALLVFYLNVGLTLYSHQQVKNLKSRIEERQRLIDRTFNLIHNGPLQTLAIILRRIRDEDISKEQLLSELEKMNLEIRKIGERLEQEILVRENYLHLGSGLTLALNQPLHELFYQVYSSTLERNLPCFTTLQATIYHFDPIEERYLNIEQKRRLCHFLEEALCNVGKHARGVTHIRVIGKWCDDSYTLSIKDNGLGVGSSSVGRGTKHGKKLEAQFKGEFKRESITPNGTLCEFTWKLK
jgi:CHASE2 domain-containing sensor protein